MKSLVVLAIFIYFVEWFRCFEGRRSCGKKKQKGRKFIDTDDLDEGELNNTFGGTLGKGKLCSCCVRAVFHYRRQGKALQVSSI